MFDEMMERYAKFKIKEKEEFSNFIRKLIYL